jgi:hypothetical protein
MTNKDFLSFFPEGVIQFFDDNVVRKDDLLAETNVSYDEAKVKQKQGLGCGCYFSVNGFISGKRTKENLSRLNAVFIDLDVSKFKDGLDIETLSVLKQDALQGVINGPLMPHFIIETRHGLQILWLIEGFNIDDYVRTEEALIRHYGADTGAKDACRVLRVPLTYHLKDPNKPFLCQLLLDNTKTVLKKYTADDFVANYDFSAITTTALHYEQSLTTSSAIVKAKSLPIKLVVEECAKSVGISISWRQNGNGTLQIVEDGKVTSGFINTVTNISYSMSGKARKGDTVSIAQFYLCEIGGIKANAHQIAEWLLYLTNN